MANEIWDHRKILSIIAEHLDKNNTDLLATRIADALKALVLLYFSGKVLIVGPFLTGPFLTIDVVGTCGDLQHTSIFCAVRSLDEIAQSAARLRNGRS